VAQLLFVVMRARPDIQTSVSFLTKRVQKPDEDDWNKLKRVLRYLKGTKHMKLSLRVDNLNTICWWVDAAYGVHMDLKGHTGMMMTLGQGALMSFSRGQKLNVRSSTEAELVGIDDAIPSIMWGKHFIEDQGYTVSHNILYQDNKSTILLARNGFSSSSKRTKHIHHRYFLVKDLIDRGEVEVKYAPTDEMWSDVFTKPLMGKKWREMRAKTMNCGVNYDDEAEAKITHPDLLPKVDPIDASSLELLKREKIIKRLKDCRKSSPIKRPAEPPPNCRRSVLGESKIAKRSRNAGPSKARS